MFGLNKLVEPEALLQLLADLAFRRYAAPLLAELRTALLSAVAGEAPPRFADALAAEGLADLPLEAQHAMWRAAVAAAAQEQVKA